MPWAHYTRNFEDVILRRALQQVRGGCFLDVGASHPVADSNTYALYELGWRGIAIDPIVELAQVWNDARPGDVFVPAAVGSSPGERAFHVMPDYVQLSTTREDQAQKWRGRGVQTLSRTAPVVTLDAVLAQHLRGRELHLLSLDVEGSEREALEGLDLRRFRPWVLIIEAVVPGTPVPNHAGWEDLVLAAQYEAVYFDGVNRFYVARERPELKRHFTLPPNVWDDFADHRLLALQRELAAIKRGQG